MKRKLNPPMYLKMFRSVQRRIANFLDITEEQAAMVLARYERTQGVQAVKDLYAYIGIELDRGPLPCGERIDATIGHDLGAIEDKWLTPRTAGLFRYVYGDEQ